MFISEFLSSFCINFSLGIKYNAKIFFRLLNRVVTSLDIVPDEFARWLFPRLLEHRRPLYGAYADEHGYTLDASDAGNVASEEDFFELVAGVLD